MRSQSKCSIHAAGKQKYVVCGDLAVPLIITLFSLHRRRLWRRMRTSAWTSSAKAPNMQKDRYRAAGRETGLALFLVWRQLVAVLLCDLP